jgi:hypothetical protein
MKLRFLPQIVFGITAILFISCKPHHEGQPSPGNTDFTRYISVGNSLTAGQADGGLYLEGQRNSYPEILAKQLKSVGGGDFFSPFFSTDQENGSGYLALDGFNNNQPHIVQVSTKLAVRGQATVPDRGRLLTKYQGPLNNYGVAGIRLSDITDANYGNLNEFFERLLPVEAPANTKSYLDFITEKPFTFFTCWIGNNDVLLYAARGGTKEDFPTDKAKFTELYTNLVTKLTAGGAKGVVATIPDVTKTAFLTTFTVSSLLKEIQKTNPQVKDLYIQTADLSVRAATAEDFFILPFGSSGLLGVKNPAGQPYGLDPSNPIEARFVLDKGEISIVKDYTESYNTTIRSLAQTKNLALYDAAAVFNDIADADGVTENGVKFTNTFLTGNLFGLDGIHLTPRGYAHVSNGLIRVINQKYGAKIPLTDVSAYRAIKTLN